MKKYILYTVFTFCALVAYKLRGQQDPTYTLYNYNMNVINPAFAGSTEGSLLTANFRSQWVGIQGGPETQSFSFSTPVGRSVGLGVSVVNSNVFVLGETDIYVDFSYKLPLSTSTNLYLGIKAGGSNIKVDLESLGVMNDPLFTENVSRFNPNIGAGAYLKGERYYISVSAPALLSSERYEKEAGIVTNATDAIHLFSGGGYEFSINKQFTFMPSVMTRWVAGTPFSMDVTGTATYNETIEVGISHRLNESISGILLVDFSDWGAFGYAYDHSITEVGDYNKGTHEIMMRFKW